MQYADIALTLRTGGYDRLLTYQITPAQLPSIALGVLVDVPFHQRTATGVLVRLRANLPDQSLKGRLRTIIRVVSPRPVLGARELALRERIAHQTAQSLSRTLGLGLPPRSIAQCYQAVPEAPVRGVPQRTVLVAGPLAPPTDLLTKIRDLGAEATVLVLTPTRDSQTRWVDWLTAAGLHQPISVYSPEISVRDQESVWTIVQGTTAGVIIATRAGVFLPMRRLELVLVDQPSHHQLREEQLPYYDALRVAEERARLWGADLAIRDPVPPLALLTETTRRTWRFVLPRATEPSPQVQIHTLTQPPDLAPATRAAIERLDRQHAVIVVVPRRGWAAGVMCQDCQTILACATCDAPQSVMETATMLLCPRCRTRQPLPATCPQCASVRLRSFGWGRAQWLASLTSQSFRPQLTVLTPAFYRLPNDAQADLIVLLEPERLLATADFRVTDEWLRLLWDAKHRARQALIIETKLPDQPMFRELAHPWPRASLARELTARRREHYPPYAPLLLITLPRVEPATDPPVALLARLRSIAPGSQVSEAIASTSLRTAPQLIWQIFIKLPAAYSPQLLQKIRGALPRTARWRIEQ
ncbi:hypothetical protein HY523_01355 [Candidatus Berkelbacteria bacterium]|nr:hypothetical protein [Candidatus Berkelbacteria bacterium]